MENQRYPADLLVSAQDFAGSGWKEALADASREGYSAAYQVLSAAAHSAMGAGRKEHGKALLVARRCQFHDAFSEKPQ